MTSNDWLSLVIVLICLMVSAFFSGSETALTASSRASMARLEKHGNHRAAIVNRLLAHRERLLGALLFGSVLLTMNLGHWYLVARALPARLLFGAASGYAALAVARALYLGLVAIVVPNPEGWEALTSLDRDLLFFLFRILWGIAGPLALSYYVFQTSKMRSNQAATGLLYVALIFVLVGELLASYLTVLTRFPA